MACRDAAQSHCEGVSTELAEREAHLEEQLQVRDIAQERECRHSSWPAPYSGALPFSQKLHTASLHKVLRGLTEMFVCQAARSEASAAAAAQMESAARSQEKLEGHLAVLRATAADCQVLASCSRLACNLPRLLLVPRLCWLLDHVLYVAGTQG